MSVVSEEIARRDIGQWLDFKKVSEKARESNKDSIDSLVDYVMEGVLEYNPDDSKLTQKLKYPTDSLTTLTYKPRILIKSVMQRLKGVKADDIDGRVRAYVSALTEQANEVINNLDTDDWKVGQSIAVFFI